MSETARKYVRPEAMTIVVVGNKKQVDPLLKKLRGPLLSITRPLCRGNQAASG